MILDNLNLKKEFRFSFSANFEHRFRWCHIYKRTQRRQTTTDPAFASRVERNVACCREKRFRGAFRNGAGSIRSNGSTPELSQQRSHWTRVNHGNSEFDPARYSNISGRMRGLEKRSRLRKEVCDWLQNSINTSGWLMCFFRVLSETAPTRRVMWCRGLPRMRRSGKVIGKWQIGVIEFPLSRWT